MRRPYVQPRAEFIQLPQGNSILETFSAKATTKDYEFGGYIGPDDWVDADGDFL
ncbi:MAG: hypothetical protein SOW66_05735 [Porphyromonas sp.]|nr:hypothetical protein [Porphyromonas sp.]